MGKQYKIAVFDVDGTLLDTTEGVLSAVRYTINKEGLKPLTPEVQKTFIGPPVQESFARIYGVPEEEAQRLAAVFRSRYKGEDLLKAVPYPGIYELCEKLRKKGVAIAIATYKREDYARTLLQHFGFDKYSDVIYGADHFNKLKKADIICKCMERLGVTDYSCAVMIGDSDNDAIGAAGLGTDFLGVTYGFGFRTKEDVMKYPSIGAAATVSEIYERMFENEN